MKQLGFRSAVMRPKDVLVIKIVALVWHAILLFITQNRYLIYYIRYLI